MPSPQPDLAGFADAMGRKRTALGNEITFYWEPTSVWPDGTPLSPETLEPYDPTIEPTSSAQASAVVNGEVVYRLQLSPTRATDAATDALGRGEKTRVAALLDIADEATIAGATEFEFHDDRFKIHSVKRDNTVGVFDRLIVYAAGKGEGD